MAVEVGVAFLSASLQVLFDRLASEEFLSLFRGEQESLKLLEELNIRLISVNKLINDAEEKQLKDKEVARWLDNLKDVIYKADDLVDKIDSEALRRKVEGESSSTSVLNEISNLVLNDVVRGFHRTVKNEATKILHTLSLLLDQNDALGLRERNERKSTSAEERSAPLVEETDVCGRKNDKEKIVDLLLSSGDNTGGKTSVIPIVGMGGIGKTTLAQLAYDDERVKKHFDVRAWVTVTEDFDVYRITETIFRTVCPDHTGHIRELSELQRMLSKALSGKRFLIVHDDVWNENYHLWDRVKGCFGSGAVGSKIVVTTRHEKVASVMAVGPTHYMAILSSEESWELFVKHAFGGNEHPRDLEAIGRKIVSKCGGLPLAVKCLGGLLRSERDPLEWESICESDVWDDLLKREANIIPALWLSYRHLPAHLKRCFAYCSMFPKNHEFDVDKMVLWWMAEGFLGTNDNAGATKSLEALGEKYFNDLLSRSLFQHRQTRHGENVVVMHDLVHDLAVIVAGEFGLWIARTEDACQLTSKTRHVSHNRESCEWHKSEGLSKAKHLRTFIGLPLDSRGQLVPLDLLFTNGSSLRVLSLCNSPITELTESVGNLIHLRHLDLSRTDIEVLPDSVCTLYNLMTLLLSWCEKLTVLPKKMENLISLRQLDVECVPLKGMEMQIKRMKSLIALNQFLVGDGNRGPKINDLKQIQPIRGSLIISRIENVVDAAEDLETNLKDKKLVRNLVLRWSSEAADGASSSEGERNVLDSLRPHTNLRYLIIEFYRGTTFPDWVGHSSFTNIVKVWLENCRSCSSLPPLGQLPSLCQLWIEGFDSVVKIGSEFLGSSPSFRCLESLEIKNMAELLEWSFGEGVTFPLLMNIWLTECPKLNISFPSFRCLAFPSLDQLRVDKCNDLDELLNGNEKGEDWPRLISNNVVSYTRTTTRPVSYTRTCSCSPQTQKGIKKFRRTKSSS